MNPTQSNANTVTIRPARADDVLQAVPLMHSSGPECMEYLYSIGPHSATDFIHWCFKRGNGLTGWRTYYVAELDGEVVATAAWYNRADYKRMIKTEVWQTLRYYYWRAPNVIRRAAPTGQWMPAPDHGQLYLAYFGVKDGLRGLGIGQQMLEFGHQLAKNCGYTSSALDVADINPRAQALYERFGFKQIGDDKVFSGPPRLGHAVPAVRRMVMPL